MKPLFLSHYNPKAGKMFSKPIPWDITFKWTYHNHNEFIVADVLPFLNLKNAILMYEKDFAWKEKGLKFSNCKKTILEISCIRSIWFILLVHDQVFGGITK
jgi:hypothetical protein